MLHFLSNLFHTVFFSLLEKQILLNILLLKIPATELSPKQCEEDILTVVSSSLNNMWLLFLDINGHGGSGTYLPEVH